MRHVVGGEKSTAFFNTFFTACFTLLRDENRDWLGSCATELSCGVARTGPRSTGEPRCGSGRPGALARPGVREDPGGVVALERWRTAAGVAWRPDWRIPRWFGVVLA